MTTWTDKLILGLLVLGLLAFPVIVYMNKPLWTLTAAAYFMSVSGLAALNAIWSRKL